MAMKIQIILTEDVMNFECIFWHAIFSVVLARHSSFRGMFNKIALYIAPFYS